MYSLFENYSETPPYLVLFCAHVLIPVHVAWRNLEESGWFCINLEKFVRGKHCSE